MKKDAAPVPCIREIAKDRKYSGLCSTCKDAPTCIYLKDSEKPVLQCEEFECE